MAPEVGRWLLLSAPRSDSPTVTVPASASSTAPARCSSVDFPEPDGPVTATNWPGPAV